MIYFPRIYLLTDPSIYLLSNRSGFNQKLINGGRSHGVLIVESVNVHNFILFKVNKSHCAITISEKRVQ